MDKQSPSPRRTDQWMDVSCSTVQHRNGRLPLRSEPPRRPIVVAPALELRAASAIPIFGPYVRFGSDRYAAMDGPYGPVLQKRSAGALLLLRGKFAVPAGVRCTGTLALHRRVHFDGCRTGWQATRETVLGALNRRLEDWGNLLSSRTGSRTRGAADCRAGVRGSCP